MMKYPQPKPYLQIYKGTILLIVCAALLSVGSRGEFSYLINLLQLCGIYTIIVTGLTLLMGYTGQVSLGHAGFFAIGAYSAAVLAQHANFGIWLVAPLGILIAALSALITGYPLLKLRAHYLALATLCVGLIVYDIINRSTLTGGAAGMYDLPKWTVFGLLDNRPVFQCLFIWLIASAGITWAVYLSESPVGRALRAIHGDESAAESLGIDTFSVKVKIFTASGALAGLAGVVYAFVFSPNYLGPEEFSLMFSVQLVTMVVIGGMGSIWGAVAGSVIMTGLREAISLAGEALHLTNTGKVEQIIFGAILVLIMIYSPEGFIPGIKKIADVIGRKRIV